MGTFTVKRRTLTESIQSVVRNAEKQFPKEESVSDLVCEVKSLVLDEFEPHVRVRKTIEKVINKTTSDALIILMNDVNSLLDQIEEIDKLKKLEFAKLRSFILHDLIIMDRERLETWTNRWEKVVWGSNEEDRTHASNMVTRIENQIRSSVAEFEGILDDIPAELRSEWSDEYFGR